MSASWGLDSWGLQAWGSIPTHVPVDLPLVTNVNPASGTEIATSTSISIDIIGDNQPIQIVVYAEYPNRPAAELVFDRGTIPPIFRTAATSFNTITGGYRLQVARIGGWPDSEVTLRFLLIDSLGHIVDGALSWPVTVAVTLSASPARRTLSAAGDPLGNGVVRPFRRTSLNDFATASGEDLVRACLGQLLGTSPGELPWKPQFGTKLYGLRHLKNSSALAELARDSIEQAIKRWEPRAQVRSVTAEPVVFDAKNRLQITLIYRVGTAADQQISVIT